MSTPNILRWTPEIGTEWKHWKGKKYIVRGFCRTVHNAVYHVLYSDENNQCWCRELSDWRTEVLPGIPRFTLVSGVWKPPTELVDHFQDFKWCLKELLYYHYRGGGLKTEKDVPDWLYSVK
jgi:hypothetical protein